MGIDRLNIAPTTNGLKPKSTKSRRVQDSEEAAQEDEMFYRLMSVEETV